MSDFIQLNSGGFILQNDGAGCILLNTGGVGPTVHGQHATPLIGPLPEQRIPVEFTFQLLSCLITRVGFKVCVRAGIKAYVKSSVKIKSSLLRKFKETFGLKASTLIETRFSTVKVKSSLLVMRETKLGIFANTQRKDLKKTKANEHSLRKKKEFLLRKLKEMLDNG